MNHYFITGVSSGIGLSLVKELLNQETELVIHGYSRRDPGINDPRFTYYKIDLSDTHQLEQQASAIFKVETVQAGDRLILVNNAGMLGNVAFVGQQQAEHYRKVFAVNTIAPIVLCEAFIEQFQALPADKIIFNISSGAANKDMEGWASYCASKSALDRFTTVCAQEQTHRKQPVMVYSVSPGVIDTPMQTAIRASAKENFPGLDRFLSLYSNGELMPADEASRKLILLLDTPDLRKQPLISLRNV